ncbi:MAG: YlxR family protein [Syntrophomonadaceae bacterium]|nr:YlxR family protein [Syntrophomonadaceae bacterium]
MIRIRKIPQRMCVGCREMKNKRELLRVVRTPDGNIEIDPTGKKSGRGAYICATISCLEQAIKANRLQKALEHEIPKNIIEGLKEHINKAQ